MEIEWWKKGGQNGSGETLLSCGSVHSTVPSCCLGGLPAANALGNIIGNQVYKNIAFIKHFWISGILKMSV